MYLLPYQWIRYKETTPSLFIKEVRLLCLIFYLVVCNVSVPGEMESEPRVGLVPL